MVDGRAFNRGSTHQVHRSAAERLEWVARVREAECWPSAEQVALGGPAAAVAHDTIAPRIEGQDRGGTQHRSFTVQLRAWCRDEPRLKSIAGVDLRKGLRRASPKKHAYNVLYPRADAKVAEEVEERIAAGRFISPRWMTMRMRRHVRAMYPNAFPDGDSFKAGKGWRQQFRKRHNLVLRMPTNTAG